MQNDGPATSNDMPEGPLPWQVVTAAISCSRQLVHKLDRALAGEELTWAQFRALEVIHDAGGWIHASSVARKTGVSRQAATALLARLNNRGSITWFDEGWIKSVRLTEAGEEALSKGWQAVSHIRDAVDRLSLEERRGIVSADGSLRRELIRRPAQEPWFWDYLPAHQKKQHTYFD
jgi:DNA-binding MarR family transcriptional regulator